MTESMPRVAAPTEAKKHEALARLTWAAQFDDPRPYRGPNDAAPDLLAMRDDVRSVLALLADARAALETAERERGLAIAKLQERDRVADVDALHKDAKRYGIEWGGNVYAAVPKIRAERDTALRERDEAEAALEQAHPLMNHCMHPEGDGWGCYCETWQAIKRARARRGTT